MDFPGFGLWMLQVVLKEISLSYAASSATGLRSKAGS